MAEAQIYNGGGYWRDNFRDIRLLGRGNTGVAAVTDASALFYNPAGLAHSQSYNVNVANSWLGGAQNIIDSFSNLKDVTDDKNASLSSKFSPFLGKPLGLEGGFFPGIAIPHFAAGFWDYMKLDLTYRNPVNPELEIDGRNDYGLLTGFAVKVIPDLAIGASMRYQRRRFVYAHVTGGAVINGTGSTLDDYVKSGEAYGLTLGTQWRRKMGKNSWYALGTTLEDVGDTRFRNSKIGSDAPPPQEMAWSTGTALGFASRLADATLLWDMRQLNNKNLSYTKKVFLGADLSLPVVDMRAGFFHGYWTAGLTLKILPLFDLDVTSYAEELDSSAGIRKNRIYMLGLRAGLAIKTQAKSVNRQKAILDAI